jgi:hypothetical protein
MQAPRIAEIARRPAGERTPTGHPAGPLTTAQH